MLCILDLHSLHKIWNRIKSICINRLRQKWNCIKSIQRKKINLHNSNRIKLRIAHAYKYIQRYMYVSLIPAIHFGRLNSHTGLNYHTGWYERKYWINIELYKLQILNCIKMFVTLLPEVQCDWCFPGDYPRPSGVERWLCLEFRNPEKTMEEIKAIFNA